MLAAWVPGDVPFCPAEVEPQRGECGPGSPPVHPEATLKASVTLDTALFVSGINRVTLPFSRVSGKTVSKPRS